MKKTIKDFVTELKADGMKCNCDLDNWEPEQDSGHSHVCRIHETAIDKYRYQ